MKLDQFVKLIEKETLYKFGDEFFFIVGTYCPYESNTHILPNSTINGFQVFDKLKGKPRIFKNTQLDKKKSDYETLLGIIEFLNED